MRKLRFNILGVTLLEIMLVLAIAGMIIVMSIRYYQSANASQQANVVLGKIQAILASADALGLAANSYEGVTTDTIAPLLSNTGGLATPWGDTITIAGAKTDFTVTIKSVPPSICGLIRGRLLGDKEHYKTVGTCPTTGSADFSYTYTSMPQKT